MINEELLLKYMTFVNKNHNITNVSIILETKSCIQIEVNYIRYGKSRNDICTVFKDSVGDFITCLRNDKIKKLSENV